MEKMTMKNLMFKIILLTIVGFVFIGCTLQPLPGETIEAAGIYHDKNKIAGTYTISIPKLNLEKTVEVGENLYQRMNQISFDTYKVNLLEDTTAKLFSGGMIRTNIHNDSTEYLLYHWMNKNAMCVDAGFYQNKRTKICLIDSEGNGYFSVAAYDYKNETYPLSNKVKYTLVSKAPVFDQDSFKYEALYQGKIGNKIKISFREFKDNMARPAFTQDIEYELNKNATTVIGFKGLRIKVLKATNLDITYKIIHDYN